MLSTAKRIVVTQAFVVAFAVACGDDGNGNPQLPDQGPADAGDTQSPGDVAPDAMPDGDLGAGDLPPDLGRGEVADEPDGAAPDGLGDLFVPPDLALDLTPDAGDPCAGVTCSDHGTCALDPVTGQAFCDCADGYTASGLECIQEPAALSVAFAYEGRWELDSLRVYLYPAAESPVTCDALALPLLPAPLTALAPSAASTADFPTSAFVGLTPEAPQTFVLVVVGLVGPLPRVVGCEAAVTVRADEPTSLTVTLSDLPPRLPATLSMRLDFDFATNPPLTSAGEPFLPELLENLLTIEQSPGPALAFAFCLPTNPQAALDVCAAAFQNPAAPNPAELTPAGLAIVGVLEDHGEALTTTACGAGVCGDLVERLAALAVRAEMTIASQPDAAGSVAGRNLALQFRYGWQGGDPAELGCAEPPAADCPAGPLVDFRPLTQAPDGGASIVLSGDPALGTAALAFDDVTAGPGFGAFVLAVVEGLLLPQLLEAGGAESGEALAGSEAWLAALLGGLDCTDRDTCCAAFAAAVGPDAPTLSDATLRAGCTALFEAVLPVIVGDVTAGDGSAGWFRLTTPAGAACPLGRDETTGDYASLGTAAAPCAVTVDVANLASPATFAATLFGR